MNIKKKLREIYFILYPIKGYYTPTFFSWWLQSRFILWAQLWIRFIYFYAKNGGKIREFSTTSHGNAKDLAKTITLNHKEQFDIIKFNRSRLEMVACLLKSIPPVFKNIRNLKLLSVGPKNEGELLMYYRYGFSWKNLTGIDLSSYSPKVKVMDMHDIKFPENSFDIVTSLWSIRYSYDLKKVTGEIQRIAKDGAIIVIANTRNADTEQDFAYNSKLDTVDEILGYFDASEKEVIWRYEEEDRPGEAAHMLVIFRIKK